MKFSERLGETLQKILEPTIKSVMVDVNATKHAGVVAMGLATTSIGASAVLGAITYKNSKKISSIKTDVDVMGGKLCTLGTRMDEIEANVDPSINQNPFNYTYTASGKEEEINK